MVGKAFFASVLLKPIDFSRRMDGRDNNFNLIRVLAAYGVIVSHAFPITYGRGVREPVEALFGWTLGALSVAVFFFISGLLLARSLDQSQDLVLWTKARCLRIFPGLLVALFVTVILSGLFVTSLSPLEYWGSVEVYTYIAKNALTLFMQYELPGVFSGNPYPGAVNGSLWTLFYEIAWYSVLLISAFICNFISNGSRGPKIFSVMCVFLLGFFLGSRYLFDGHEGVCGAFCIRTSHMFNLGVYFVLGTGAWVFRSRLRVNGLIVGAGWCLVLLTKDALLGGPVLIGTLTMSVLYAAYGVGGWIQNFNKLGDYSYGMYIYAFPIQQFIAQSFAQWGWGYNVLLSLPLVLFFAVCSWHVIEKPALRLTKVKLSRQLRLSYN